MNTTRATGLAVLCDRAGVIRQVLSADFDPSGTLSPGQNLLDWVDPGSREKLANLFAALRAGKSAFDWELNVRTGGQIVTPHFSGVANGDDVLIVASHNRNGILELYEEMMRINNDQVNALRSAIKTQTETALGEEHSTAQYDALTRLNNELVDLQRELAKKNVELEKLNRQKNQFLGMAAHDLRNPLSLIIAYSRFLEEEIAPLLTPLQKEFLEIIGASSLFMRGLVEDLLDVSAIEAGQLKLALELTDVAVLVERNVERNRILASQQGRELVCRCADALAPLMIDRAKFDQVLNNLISNAIKYSFPGTTIRVELERVQEELVLAVRDRGQGIPAAETGRLFQVFGKTSATSTTGEKSTGLGLAIVQRIVQGHGGRIWVESEPGQETSFFVALPIPPTPE